MGDGGVEILFVVGIGHHDFGRNKPTLAIALPQHNNKGAQLIAEKLRIPVRYVDPYAADYFDTMRKLSELIANPYATAPGI